MMNSDDYDFFNDPVLESMVQDVSSRDIYMHHLYSKALTSHSRKVKIELMRELNHMMYVDEVFSVFLDQSIHKIHECRFKSESSVEGFKPEDEFDSECNDDFIPKDFDCLRSFMATYEQNCGKMNDYSRKFVKFFVRECEQPTMQLQDALNKLE